MGTSLATTAAAREPAPSPSTISVATGCASADEFIAAFNRFCEKDSFFVATSTKREVGTEVVFQVLLTDGERMLRGLGPVVQAFTAADSPFRVPGVQIGISKLTPASAKMFARLREARAAAPVASPSALPRIPAPGGPRRPTIQVPVVPVALVPPSVPRTRSVSRPIPVLATSLPHSVPTRRLSTMSPWSAPPTGAIPVIAVVEKSTAHFAAQPDPPAKPPVIDKPVEPQPEPLPDAPVVPRTITRPTREIRRPANEPIVGERTPGSSFILPANPLTDFADADIGAFVDGATFLTEGASMVPAELEAPVQVMIDAAPRGEPSIVIEPTLLGPQTTASPSDQHRILASTTTASEPLLRKRRLPGARTWAMGAAAVALLAIAGIAFSAVGGSTPGPKPVAPVVAKTQMKTQAQGATQAQVAPTPAPTPTPTTAPDPAPVEPTTAPVEPTETPAIATDPVGAKRRPTCHLDVTVSPAGTPVRVDGRYVGVSPVSIDTSCRRHKVIVARAHYTSIARWVRPTPTRPAVLDVAIHHPAVSTTTRLAIASSPGGASVYVDGHAVGFTPVSVKVLSTSNVTVKVIKPGYAAAVRTYTGGGRKSDKLAVTLAKK